MGLRDIIRGALDVVGSGINFFTLSSNTQEDIQLNKADIVTSVTSWLAKGVARVELQTALEGSERDPLRILERPSTYYNGKNLLAAIAVDLCVVGTSHVRMLTRGGRLIGLMWIPHVQDISNNGKLEAYKYYTASGGEVIVPPRDMVVFRNGIDPGCIWRGRSPLRNTLNEVLTDEEAASFTYDTLKNMPVAGMLVGPKEGSFSSKTKADHEALEGKFQKHFSGDKRGRASLVTHAFEIGYMQPDMNKIDLAKLREIPEERICAALGVQPAVVSLGAGLQTTKVGATMIEMTRQSWRDGTMPLITIIQDAYNEQLVNRFDPGNYLKLSTSKIDDLRMSVDEITKLVSAQIITPEKAAELVGVEYA